MLITAALLAFSRVFFLDADPSLFKRVGDIGDEGYWVQQARDRALFGDWVTDEFVQGLAAAPLFTILTYGVFSAGGVSLFGARLVTAVAGVFSVLLIYLIVRRSAGRAAVAAAFILSINSSFFSYNRIAHPESLVIMFLLFGFFFLAPGRTGPGRCFFAGICLALAILSKITAAYFLPAAVLYLIALRARREIDWKGIALSVAGLLSLLVPVALVYYFPFYHLFEVTLTALSNQNPAPLSVAMNLFFLTSNHYFSLPSVFMLVIGSLIYFGRRGFSAFLTDIRGNVKCLGGVELIALCWFFGYIIVLLTSTMQDRRFTLLAVPLVIFSALLFGEGKRHYFADRGRFGALACAVLLIPMINLLAFAVPIIASVFGRLCGPVSPLTVRGVILAAAAVVVVVAGASSLRENGGRRMRRWFPSLSVACLVLALSLNFSAKNCAIIGFIFGPVPKPLQFAVALALSVLIVAGLRYGAFLLKMALSFAYIFFCGAVIFPALAWPSFSLREVSRGMARLCGAGEYIIGPGGHDLSLENRLKPLMWIPNSKRLSRINRDAIERHRPRYYLRMFSFGGEKTHLEYLWPTPEQTGGSITEMETITLFPVMGKPRKVLKLYRIDYSDEGGRDKK